MPEYSYKYSHKYSYSGLVSTNLQVPPEQGVGEVPLEMWSVLCFVPAAAESERSGWEKRTHQDLIQKVWARSCSMVGAKSKRPLRGKAQTPQAACQLAQRPVLQHLRSPLSWTPIPQSAIASPPPPFSPPQFSEASTLNPTCSQALKSYIHHPTPPEVLFELKQITPMPLPHKPPT